ncbi:MAG: CofH family radical SAM protein [Planctomycetota bacterium]|nr:CofH family radical SAM protein [Planctomycetota bacterium]
MIDLKTIENKVAAGRRLSREDGLALFESPDLLAVAAMADRVRQARHGRRAYYCVNTHVNYTNRCENECGLCAFWAEVDGPSEILRGGSPHPPRTTRDHAPAGRPRAAGPETRRAIQGYLLTPEEVLERARPDLSAGAPEVHIVGGLAPEVSLDYCLRMVALLHEAYPAVCIQAFTAVEIASVAKKAGLAPREVLAKLKTAGLTGLPGGGAEIFDPAVRERICPKKISGQEWIAIHREAHRLNLTTNATMLYGHVETPAHRVDHLLALRGLQDETGGLAAFIPLPFHPRGTKLPDLPGTTACDDLRTIAVSRLVLDNVPHIKAFWIMLTPDLAQVALRFGADDLDGTVVREEITHAAGAETPQGLTAADLAHFIRAAGCEPVERDTLYRPVVR